MKHLSFNFSALIISAFLSISGNAFAENGHAYNGSYCDNYFGSQADDFNHQYNGIRNKTSTTRVVSCPVLVDEIANTTGTTKVWVHYTGTGAVSCYLFSMNPNGSASQTRSGNRTNTGWFSIANITSDNYWGSYSMYCFIPSGGVLNTIWLGAKD